MECPCLLHAVVGSNIFEYDGNTKSSSLTNALRTTLISAHKERRHKNAKKGEGAPERNVHINSLPSLFEMSRHERTYASQSYTSLCLVATSNAIEAWLNSGHRSINCPVPVVDADTVGRGRDFSVSRCTTDTYSSDASKLPSKLTSKIVKHISLLLENKCLLNAWGLSNLMLYLVNINTIFEAHTGHQLLDGSIYRHHFFNVTFFHNSLLIHDVLLIHKSVPNAFSLEDQDVIMQRLIRKYLRVLTHYYKLL